MEKSIAVLPGDGIGEEVMREALRVLSHIAEKFGHSFTFQQGLVGGAAYDEHEAHFPDETKALCETMQSCLAPLEALSAILIWRSGKTAR